MRIFLPFLVAILFAQPSHAQEEINDLKKAGTKKKSGLDSNGWKHTGLFTLNINQAALSDWSSGGENFIIGINGILNKSMHHRYGKYTWDAYLDLELGVVEASSFKQFRKTSDRIDITSEFEHEMGGEHFYYGILFNFNSQLFGGHNYNLEDHPKISSFLSPGKILLCLGIEYKDHSPSRYFSAFITPLTLRWITKIDPDFSRQKKFGVDSAQKVYTEVGAYLSLHYSNQFSKTVKYIGRLDLFSNYKRNPQNIDVLMNNLFSFAISKNFAGSLVLDIIYDDDIKRRTQVQEMFGIGLKFNL